MEHRVPTIFLQQTLLVKLRFISGQFFLIIFISSLIIFLQIMAGSLLCFPCNPESLYLVDVFSECSPVYLHFHWQISILTRFGLTVRKNSSFVTIFGQHFFRIRHRYLFTKIWNFFVILFVTFQVLQPYSSTDLAHALNRRNLCVFDILVLLHCWIERKLAGFYLFVCEIHIRASISKNWTNEIDEMIDSSSIASSTTDMSIITFVFIRIPLVLAMLIFFFSLTSIVHL